MKRKLPEFGVTALIVGIAVSSEGAYSLSIVDIVKELSTFAAMAGYTVTFFLLGPAVGTLCLGHMSDKVGRNAVVIIGLLVFMVG